MPNYPDLIERLFLNSDLHRKLHPTEPINWEWLPRIREASDEALTGGAEVKDPRMLALVRGALYCAADALDAAHRIFQDEPGNVGSYWHGIMHRREADFDNARYWFRRAGELPTFKRMHAVAREESPTMARQTTWDPYLFTGLCEQVKYGAEELNAECVALQQAEFTVLFAYCWRQALGLS